MPIYEFRCQKCSIKSSFLLRSVSESFTPQCQSCGSTDLVRAISSFAYHKSMQTIWEDSGEPQKYESPDFYKDPRNIGRYAEKMFKDMGEEMPPHLQEEIQAAREGELPQSLKEKL